MRSFFITGTDTEVGKTAMSCALLHAAAERGFSTAAVKPVAAGCDDNGRNNDALALQEAASRPLPYEAVNPVALRAAIAPHIAARWEKRRLRVAELVPACTRVMEGGADIVLIEGAGGWRVPLSESETLADLAIALATPVVLVVGMRLGCINHALLSADAIAADGLRLAGWIANQPGPRMNAHEANLETLQAMLPAPFLGDVPLLQPWDPRAAARYLDSTALWGLSCKS